MTAVTPSPKTSASLRSNIRKLTTISALTLFLSGCTPAEKVSLYQDMDASVATDQSSSGSDTSVTQVDAQPVDMQLEPDAMCSEEICGNDMDEDCDGQVDECPSGTECIASQCVQSGNDSCASNLDCSGTDLCDDGRCTLYRASSCGDQDTCDGRTHCSTAAGGGCNQLASCIGVAGGTCAEQCDCGGQLLCEAASGRCVECVSNGQCDQDRACNASGHCMPTVMISSGTLADIQGELLSLFDSCLLLSEGRTSKGCAAITFQQPLTIDDRAAERLSVSGLLTDEPCSLVESMRDEIPAAYEALGCDGADPPRLLWNTTIDSRAEPAACIVYLPYTPIADGQSTTWAVWFGPCEQAADASF